MPMLNSRRLAGWPARPQAGRPASRSHIEEVNLIYHREFTLGSSTIFYEFPYITRASPNCSVRVCVFWHQLFKSAVTFLSGLPASLDRPGPKSTKRTGPVAKTKTIYTYSRLRLKPGVFVIMNSTWYIGLMKSENLEAILS